MTAGATRAVVVDTMVVSALINAARQPEIAAEYAQLIEARPVVVSFATVTELRYGATAIRLDAELVSDDRVFEGVSSMAMISGG